MEEPKFKVFDGGRPDDEESILSNLTELAKQKGNADSKVSPRVLEMRSRLSDDATAEKYVRYALYKLSTALPLTAERDWIPALLRLFETIPAGRGLDFALAAIKENPEIYKSEQADMALRQWATYLANRDH